MYMYIYIYIYTYIYIYIYICICSPCTGRTCNEITHMPRTLRVEASDAANKRVVSQGLTKCFALLGGLLFNAKNNNHFLIRPHRFWCIEGGNILVQGCTVGGIYFATLQA